MAKRRVVVTGMGAVTPIGLSVDEFWQNVKAQKTGFSEITKFDTTNYKCKLAAEVKEFDAKNYMDAKEARRMELFSQYAVAAAKEAIEDAGLEMDQEDPYMAGCAIGSGVGSLQAIEREYTRLTEVVSDKGKRLRIYYTTQVSVKPPTFVIFVNDKQLMHFSYTRYLENRIRDTFGFRGTALRFIIRERKENEK